jgi:outer membrane protein OmpA-like peptidoglycan-associated protein
VALRRQEEERLETERRLAAEREAAAKATADEEAFRRAEADRLRLEEEQRRLQAEKTAEQRRLEAEESARLRAEEERRRQEAEAGQRAALTQQQQAEELARLREAEAQRQRLAAEEADRKRQQAEREKEELRSRLLQQLNTILETRDTARGLIVNMSDVLFDFNKATLRAGAREKLAKISGVLMTYPELKIEVEGHTDSVGSEEYNQSLSEKRALSVVEYLTKQGVSHELMSYTGLGEAVPVADNKSAAGRQQNRRVELVVSGEVIGTRIGGQQTDQPNPEMPSTEPPSKPR